VKYIFTFLVLILSSLLLIAGDTFKHPTMLETTIKKDTINQKAKKKSLNAVCDTIPTMLIHLPPMLEKDLNKCKNSLYKPSIDVAKKRLEDMIKKDVKVSKVSTMKGFCMLYAIETDVGIFYCNRYVDRCFISSMKIVE